MMNNIKKSISRESLEKNPFFKRFSHIIFKEDYWHLSKETVAKGLALGAFFAFVTPIAQIPLAIVFTVLLRANIPAGILATFINTPLTFGPVYYGAYLLGSILIPVENLEDKTQAVMLGALMMGVSAAILAYILTILFWEIISKKLANKRNLLENKESEVNQTL